MLVFKYDSNGSPTNKLIIIVVLGKCYLPESGLTLIGSDYRRFSDVDQVSVCARACLSDCACFGFVWFKNGTCTLKSRSLDSAVSANEDARFGLCIDEGRTSSFSFDAARGMIHE